MRVHHLAIVVADLARAEAFYVGVLGLPVLRRWSDDAGVPRSIWVGLDGDAFVAIERASREGGRDDEDPGLHCLAFAIDVEDREPTRSRLDTAGFPVFRETAYTLYARDPDGNLIGFSHWPIAT